jgi:hypothetical protein
MKIKSKNILNNQNTNDVKIKKSIFERIILGIKSSSSLETFPPHIIKLNKTIPIRVLRILGPLCTFFMLSGYAFKIGKEIYYLTFIISFIYILYRYTLAFYSVKQFFHYVANGSLVVRNSPVDLLYTMVRVTWTSMRKGAKLTFGAGFTYALCHELDDILVKEGKDPYFIPNLKARLDDLGFTAVAGIFLKNIGIKYSAAAAGASDSPVVDILLKRLENISAEESNNF